VFDAGLCRERFGHGRGERLIGPEYDRGGTHALMRRINARRRRALLDQHSPERCFVVAVGRPWVFRPSRQRSSPFSRSTIAG